MQVTKESIQAILLRTDEVGKQAVGRALVVLMNNQTADEKERQATRHDNGRGFTPSDARKGTSMADFYLKTGFLTPRQLAYWQQPARTEAGRIRITKYWKQLLEAAQKKEQKKLAQQMEIEMAA